MCNLDSLRKGPQAILDLASLLAHLFEIYGQPLTTFGGVVTRIDFAYRGGRRDQAMWSHR